MPTITVTLSTTYEVPEGTVKVVAPTGVDSGLLLPCGKFIKPWIAMELQDGEFAEDIDEMELNKMGVMTALDFSREIVGNLDEKSLEGVGG